MSKNAKKKSWLTAVSERAGATASRVEDVLAKHRIQPSPTAAAPRRLSLTEVRFSGNKDGVEKPGPFEFHWRELDHGLWGMVSESNLKGKSSVIEIVRWLLRGRPSDNLQEDVRRWISEATVGFRLDQSDFVIKLANAATSIGTLVEIKSSGKEHQLGSFENATDFESVMADFFLKAFSLESVTVWRDGAEEASGQAVVHSWPAMSGVMFIGTDYSSLLGDLPPTSGLPIRLMQMYLGLPWISTLTAVKAVQKELTREIDARERRRLVVRFTNNVVVALFFSLRSGSC